MQLHDYHQKLGARFVSVNGAEVVGNYGDVLSEHRALVESAGILDLSFRSRICLTGADRIGFLHGQVTNDVKGLAAESGCYAALVTAKGRMQSDLNIYRLAEELLLDFEPGLSQSVSQRLEKYVISEDVQITDVAELYGLLSVQGPKASSLIRSLAELGPFSEAGHTVASSPPEKTARPTPARQLPEKPFSFVTAVTAEGEVYVMNRARFGSAGYDLFLPVALLPSFASSLASAANRLGGRFCGWEAAEIARIEAGIPKFGTDMDETNIPLEAGVESSAISFSKGCYIGQEVISRIRTYSEISKALRGLRLADDLKALPGKGEKLYKEGKEAGYVTSAIRSPRLGANIALAYVKKESNQEGTELMLRGAAGETPARIVALPFA